MTIPLLCNKREKAIWDGGEHSMSLFLGYYNQFAVHDVLLHSALRFGYIGLISRENVSNVITADLMKISESAS